MLVFLTAGKENKTKTNIPHEILTVKKYKPCCLEPGSQSKFELDPGREYLASVRRLQDRQTVLIIFWWLLWAVALVSENRQIPRAEKETRHNHGNSGGKDGLGPSYYIFLVKSREDFSAVHCPQGLYQESPRWAPCAAVDAGDDPYFTHQETEALCGYLNCPAKKWQSQDSNRGLSNCEVPAPSCPHLPAKLNRRGPPSRSLNIPELCLPRRWRESQLQKVTGAEDPIRQERLPRELKHTVPGGNVAQEFPIVEQEKLEFPHFLLVLRF